jgi:hypothetical protein
VGFDVLSLEVGYLGIWNAHEFAVFVLGGLHSQFSIQLVALQILAIGVLLIAIRYAVWVLHLHLDQGLGIESGVGG